MNRLRDWGFFSGPPTWDPVQDMPDQSGRIVLITGPTAGLGRSSLLPLVRHGARVLLLARDESKALKTIEEVQAAAKQAGPAPGTADVGSLDFLRCDLADLTSVREAAVEVKAKTDRIHILFANAGVLGVKQLTAQGHEMTFGVNVLGHFLLLLLLEDLLFAAAASSQPHSVRAIILASSAHQLGMPSRLTAKWDPSDGTKWAKDTTAMYSRSKLGDLHLSLKLSQRWADKGVVAVAVHPGNWESDILRARSKLAKLLVHKLICKGPENGPITQLWTATVSDEETSARLNGAYVVPWTRLAQPSKSARDQAKADRTWEWCEEAAREFLQPVVVAEAAGAQQE